MEVTIAQKRREQNARSKVQPFDEEEGRRQDSQV